MIRRLHSLPGLALALGLSVLALTGVKCERTAALVVRRDDLIPVCREHARGRPVDLTKEDEPVKIERDLMKILPREKWILFSHQIIHHGRSLCSARSPKCIDCALSDLCYAKDRVVGDKP